MVIEKNNDSKDCWSIIILGMEIKRLTTIIAYRIPETSRNKVFIVKV